MLNFLFSRRSPRRPDRVPKDVWLTFDDGPDPIQTPRVLDILEKHGAKATFFILGERAEVWPHLVREVARQGHAIGNHSYSHPRLTKLGRAEILDELQRNERIIGPDLSTPKFFRPPYGARNATVDNAATYLGYRSFLWNCETDDWDQKRPPGDWVESGLRDAAKTDRAVVLMHDIHDGTAQHLDAFISRLLALGDITFRTIRDL